MDDLDRRPYQSPYADALSIRLGQQMWRDAITPGVDRPITWNDFQADLRDPFLDITEGAKGSPDMNYERLIRPYVRRLQLWAETHDNVAALWALASVPTMLHIYARAVAAVRLPGREAL